MNHLNNSRNLSTQFQTTLKKPVSCSGVGVHTNAKVSLTIAPAEPNSGIIFKRIDLGFDAEIPALVDNVIDTKLCTVLGSNGYGGNLRVATVEHLMAALFGAGIDNAIVQIDGPEVPVMDGSAEPFLFLLECAGKRTLNAPRKVIKITEEILVKEGNSIARITPSETFEITCSINFDHKLIGKQVIHYTAKENFKDKLSSARTFCLESEILKMRAAGLALGGSLRNAVVFSESRVLNEGGLRFPDEPARHKALDLIGDLYLLGTPIIGHIETLRAGHSINHKLSSFIIKNRSFWSLIDCPKQIVQPDAPLVAAASVA